MYPSTVDDAERNRFILDSVPVVDDSGSSGGSVCVGREYGRGSRGRAWCFTWNNPPELACLVISHWHRDGVVTYVCYQHEVGESGTPHLQGYLEFEHPRTLGGVKGALAVPELHLERRAGTAEQAIAYCHKAGGSSYCEYGNVRNSQGKRNDLAAVKADIQAGELNELELVEEHFSAYARYHRFFGMYRELRRRYTDEPSYSKKTVLWYGGDTGTGKTAKALSVLRSQFPGYAVYLRPSTTGQVAWFPGFSVEHLGMIIDEFRSDIQLAVMLRLLDGYSNSVETKGGFVDTRYLKVVIITSNYLPWECYKNMDNKTKQPLYRRIDQCLWFPKGVNECPQPWERTNELKALLL